MKLEHSHSARRLLAAILSTFLPFSLATTHAEPAPANAPNPATNPPARPAQQPLRYPAVEAVTAVLVAACALKFGVSWAFGVAAVFCAVLVAISATDLERRIIPNRLVLPATVVLLAAQTVLHPSVEWIVAGLGAGSFFLIAALAYPRRTRSTIDAIENGSRRRSSGAACTTSGALSSKVAR